MCAPGATLVIVYTPPAPVAVRVSSQPGSRITSIPASPAPVSASVARPLMAPSGVSAWSMPAVVSPAAHRDTRGLVFVGLVVVEDDGVTVAVKAESVLARRQAADVVAALRIGLRAGRDTEDVHGDARQRLACQRIGHLPRDVALMRHRDVDPARLLARQQAHARTVAVLRRRMVARFVHELYVIDARPQPLDDIPSILAADPLARHPPVGVSLVARDRPDAGQWRARLLVGDLPADAPARCERRVDAGRLLARLHFDRPG